MININDAESHETSKGCLPPLRSLGNNRLRLNCIDEHCYTKWSPALYGNVWKKEGLGSTVLAHVRKYASNSTTGVLRVPGITETVGAAGWSCCQK